MIGVRVSGGKFYRWKDIEHFVVDDRQDEGGTTTTTYFILHFHNGKIAEIKHYYSEKTSAELSSLFQAYLSR
jgi:ketosteroid isomerase-like protein